MNLNQKEQLLLQDQLAHEKVCIDKYTNYAQQTQDQQLKQLFSQIAGQEQQHYSTINQMLQGQQPNYSGGSSGAIQQGKQQQPNMQAGMSNVQDKVMLEDTLMTEKFVSGAYDTAIFESANTGIRQALQHIQQEEQQHGESLFNYMQQHGIYKAQ